ncbi:MAG: hypothetical protein ACI8YQ_001774 [Polaribacter sp.]|jgi:hypothetical protein
MFGFLKKLFGGKDNSINLNKEELIDAGACPNCWGKQEYGGAYTEYTKDQTKSNVNHDKLNQKTFVQQFVETNITGIRLKREGDHLSCPTCNMKYKSVSSKAN